MKAIQVIKTKTAMRSLSKNFSHYARIGALGVWDLLTFTDPRMRYDLKKLNDTRAIKQHSGKYDASLSTLVVSQLMLQPLFLLVGSNPLLAAFFVSWGFLALLRHISIPYYETDLKNHVRKNTKKKMQKLLGSRKQETPRVRIY